MNWTKYSIIGYTCLLFFLLISGCSTVSKKDGPPSFYVDETKIPNAVPRVEPKAKYGNMSSYSVFGKRYYVLRSARNFEQQGVASWYGTKFHSRYTSSGERYNMLAMTAAHKTLPLPTYLLVTNLKNHKQVIVKVNDRGPFEGNRIIDLSYVAAKKLGMLGHGTTRVDIKAIDPTKPLDRRIMVAKRKSLPDYRHYYAANKPSHHKHTYAEQTKTKQLHHSPHPRRIYTQEEKDFFILRN